MTITTSLKSIYDSTKTAFNIKTLVDSSDTTATPAHALVKYGNGALINPAEQGLTAHLTNTPTVTAGAYTAGQVVGGLITLTGAARFSGGGGLIQAANIGVKTALTAPYDILFFDTNPTNSTFTDNSALALNVADIPYLCGVVHCVDLVSYGTPQGLQALNQALPYACAATSLYAVIVIRGGQTFASTSAVILNVMTRQD